MYRSKNIHLKKIMLQKEPEKKKKSLLCKNGYTVCYLSLVTGIDATTMELWYVVNAASVELWHTGNITGSTTS
jgi:hypothetical protein